MEPTAAKPAPDSSLSDRLGLILLIAVLGVIVWRLMRVSNLEPPVSAGTPLPAFQAEGWLNTDDGAEVEAANKLVVVDCWASWCGPCLADLPQLVEIAADYRRQGVEFVSITQETAVDLPQIEAVMKRTPGFNWPIAYGGKSFQDALGIQAIPTLILFGRDGKALWSQRGGSAGLWNALDAALADDRKPAA
jgi:thiol-disulfide isomerase/thioredoxin